MTLHYSPLTLVALVSTVLAAIILLTYIVAVPPLVRSTKLWLLFGLGVFPIGAAAAGNVEGFEATKERRFCGSCHVMVPHAQDSGDPTSTSLASLHARNPSFGAANCYTCHADYGLFGTVVTKLGGMRHVYEHFFHYRNTPIEEAKRTIHLRKPFPNANCMQCHSTQSPVWQKQPDHKAAMEDVRVGRIACASGGCHGFAHPFWKSDEERAKADDAASKARKAAALRDAPCPAPSTRGAASPAPAPAPPAVEGSTP